MKINKETSLNGVERLERGGDHSTLIQIPTGGDILGAFLEDQAGGRKKISPHLATAQPMRHYHNSTMKSHYTSNFQFPIERLFVIAPRNLFFSFIKILPLLFVVFPDLLVVHHSCMSPVTILKLLFLINCLAGKNLCWFCLFVLG